MKYRSYKLREATLTDIPELREMYKATLRTVNIANYTLEEIEDWASCGDDTAHLADLITNLYFIVALNEANQIIGFTSIRKDGYLHSMFVHKDYQRKGVASFLLSKAEEYAIENQMKTITSEVCVTAKPFFERKGYTVVKEQKRKANKLCLTNYWMIKRIVRIQPLKKEKYQEATSLSLYVFTTCNRADYNKEGLEVFKKFIHNKEQMNELTMLGAFNENVLVGVLGIRKKDSHLSMFFIHPDYQQQGIGKKLFNCMLATTKVQSITVNASTSAVPFYKQLGFAQLAEATNYHGLISVPMKWQL